MTRTEIAERLAQSCVECDRAYDNWKKDQRSDELWADFTSHQRTASDVLRVNLPTILAALRGPDEAAVERAAEAVMRLVTNDLFGTWDESDEGARSVWRGIARAALAAAEQQP